MATRKAPKALNKSAAEVAANAKEDRARKVASKKALKASTAPVETAPVVDPAIQREVDRKHDEDRFADNLKAAQIEANATGMTFPEACESMGIDQTTGAPIAPAKGKYTGPMLVLRQAAKTYVKGANGQPHCGDEIGTLFSGLSRETTVRVCVDLLKLPGNPYLHLNPGQQSMNLRNKLRAAWKAGTISIPAIAEVVQALR